MLLCQTGSQHASVTAITPINIYCSYRCAVTHHQRTATKGFGKLHSTLSRAALQNKLTACLCHCNYTYQDLLLLQVCSDPSPMHCNQRFWQSAFPTVSAALQNRLTACLCHYNYTYQHLLLIQVSSDPPPMLCSTGFGKMQSTMSSAAPQNRLAAALCLCNHTYQDLLFIQVCSEPPPNLLLSAALQNSRLLSLQLHLY